MKLAGKVVLITGASEGLGAACARVFRSRGAKLALAARSRENLEASAEPEDLILPGDLTNPDARRAAIVGTLARFGTIDVLVNNAGIGLYVPAFEASPEQARAIFELNFFAPLELAQLAAVPMRKQRSGCIVNISSIAGLVTLPWLTLYSASKHALRSLTEGLGMEMRRYGIHTMTVCPGYIDTKFQEHAMAGTPPPALRRNRPLSVAAEECAHAIVRGVERERRLVLSPPAGRLLSLASACFPGLIAARLEKMYSQIR